MIKKFIFVIILCNIFIVNTNLADDFNKKNYWDKFSQAKILIQENKSLEAISILEQLEKIDKNHLIEISLGDAYSAINNPLQALQYYEKAYQQAKHLNNETIIRVTLFKIGHTGLWLKNYNVANNAYKLLLTKNLSAPDKEIALKGLENVRKVELNDNIIKAREYIKKNDGKEAYHLIKAYMIDKNNFDLNIIAAQSMAIMNDPYQSLIYYKNAYSIAQNNIQKKVALLGMIKIQIWLNDGTSAQKSIKLLKATQLTKEEEANFKKMSKKIELTELNNVLIKAAKLIELNKGKESYELIKNLLKKEKNYKLYYIAGQSMAIMEKPNSALEYFQKALSLSNNSIQKKTSLFNILQMQIWLEKVIPAKETIHLLNKYNLNKTEKEKLSNYATQLKKIVEKIKLEQTISRASQFIELNEGTKAYILIQPYLSLNKNYRIEIIAAESMALLNYPYQALNFYQSAYLISENLHEKIKALFGVAKMQFWLAHYVKAANTFKSLLTLDLSPLEHELALAGLVKSLAYYDRPRAAFHLIPDNFTFSVPASVIAAAQASLWSDWADITKNLLTKNAYITDSVDLNSGLGKDLLDLKWQTDLATWPNVVSPTFFYSSDSDSFNKRQTTVEYSHYWNQSAQTIFGPDYTEYTQNSYPKLNAKGFYIGQTFRPTREIVLTGRLEPMKFNNLKEASEKGKNWNTLLWKLNGAYKPNDYLFINLNTNKEVIETFPAFYNKITDHQYAASLTLNPLPYFQINGSLSRMDMSDSNHRNGYFLSASLRAFPEIGVTVTGIMRGFNNKFQSSNYFSPHKYREQKGIVTVGRRLGATWDYYVDGGYGKQYITATSNSSTHSSPTYQYGLGLNGPISNWLSLNIYYAKLNQASAFINSSAYSYQYGAVKLNILL